MSDALLSVAYFAYLFIVLAEFLDQCLFRTFLAAIWPLNDWYD
jgi:hypothetical protein